MQAYTNKFSIALNQDKSEVILNFFQNVPTIPQQDESENLVVSEFKSEIIPIANLAMTGQCARNLASALLQLLDHPTDQE